MILLNVFSIVKYGAKIFLAVMGFISFEDINVKPVGNIDPNVTGIQKLNYVEKMQTGVETLSYADASYFLSENNKSNKLFTTQNDYIAGSETFCSNESPKNNFQMFENIFLLADEKIEDLEILIINVNDELSLKCFIREIDNNKITQSITNSLKSIQIIDLSSTH